MADFSSINVSLHVVYEAFMISVYLQVLEFLPQLVEALTNEGYVLTDAEAAIFLPCLVEKV